VQNPNVKGAVAEQAIVLAATKLRIPVWRPVAEHGRYDLVLEVGDRLWRVQVKWGRLGKARDVIVVHTGTCRLTPNGYVRGTYTVDEVDLFGVYCGELDRCFLLPLSVAAGKHAVQLRLTPPLNGQRACINLADDFEFEGAVAQLARAPAWHAGGRGFESLQLHSSESSPLTVACDDFRDHLGYWFDEAARGEHLLVTRRGKPLVRVSAAVPPLPLSANPPPLPPQWRPGDRATAPAQD
jgi:antitoxin (DNA-binding transcriptional repressor) of toxin-antitoxin stability system